MVWRQNFSSLLESLSFQFFPKSFKSRKMPITFIAVQCFQCSTMQVKQQKKSSNKWNCVVCDEKQSVRKIFTQGGIAKDVRSFVQSFNMSRKFADENLMEETLISSLEEIGRDPSQNYNSYQRKRRNDWSEYLDPDEVENNDKGQEQEVEDEFEPDIVTELPKDMFRKPKLRNYAVGMNKSEGKKSYSPIFAKRKPNQSTAPYFREEDEFETQIATELPKDMFKKPKLRNYTDGMNKAEGNKSYSPTFAKRKTNQSTGFLGGKLCSSNVAQKEGFAERSERSKAHHKPYSPIFAKSKTNQPTVPQGKLCSSNVAQKEVFAERNEPREAHQIATTQATASTWAEYLTPDEDDLLFQGGKNSPEPTQPWKLSASGNQFDDQRVEEDVHPDFIW